MAEHNPKSELVIFLQRFIGRTLTKEDVIYSTVKHGELFQGTARLACCRGEEYSGELCASEKEATKSAAAQVLLAFSAEIAALPPKAKGRTALQSCDVQGLATAAAADAENQKTELVKILQAHCRRTLTRFDVVYEVVAVGAEFQATVRLLCTGGQEFVGEVRPTEKLAEHSAAQQALLASATWLPAVPVEAPPELAALELLPQKRKAAAAATSSASNPKSELVMFLQRYIRRTLTKQDIVYTHQRVANGLQFQATVNLVCLDGRQFTGLPSPMQKGADASAAELALQALSAEVGPLPPAAKKARASRPFPASGIPTMLSLGLLGSKVAAHAGVGRHVLFAAGMPARVPASAGRPSVVPAAGPRQVVVDDIITGEVVEWNPMGYGFIRPHLAINHKLAQTRGGRIYVHIKDLAAGSATPAPGSLVQFRVYADARGLGAAEALAF